MLVFCACLESRWSFAARAFNSLPFRWRAPAIGAKQGLNPWGSESYGVRLIRLPLEDWPSGKAPVSKTEVRLKGRQTFDPSILRCACKVLWSHASLPRKKWEFDSPCTLCKVRLTTNHDVLDDHVERPNAITLVST